MDTIKQFLEADANRLQGEWKIIHNKGYLDQSYRIGIQTYTTIASVENGAEDEEYGGLETEKANANFIALASTLAPAIRTMLADLEMARAALLKYGNHTDHCSVMSTISPCDCGWRELKKALSALDKYKGGV